MLDFSSNSYSGPTTTADSAADGRMKADVRQLKGKKAKKAIIKKHLKKLK